MKLSRAIIGIFFILWVCNYSSVSAQQSKPVLMAQLTALQNDYVNRIKAMGYKPGLKVPPIVLNNPRSFGNYDDSTNTLQTCDWNTINPQIQQFFNQIAAKIGGGITGQKFFDVAVHKWIFIHEMSHWWRACQHITADPYENEKAANRLASAYWNERDPAFYHFMVKYFTGVVTDTPSPVPAGISKEQYLKENYNKLPGGHAYTWYQSIMIVEVSKEKPFETFKQAVKLGGKPLR